ncbi:MAG: hypothetical protein QG574_2981 [Cyanobacteriota bacterium erpe_2018_sw_21hr_WHONDRS-SW48-000092_B_bin.40]|jgi:hypothetical protein|nr:hypothetical protein [Cyanobacteriota bacterium erpe_2018_sw_21hr_WHONDRS-SW48-000092_B_bin.40]
MPILTNGDLSAANQNAQAKDGVSTLELCGETVKHLPDASVAFAKELYDKPVEAAVHIGTTLATSAAMGVALGYVLPGRGPAAMAIGAAFTMPVLIHGYNRVQEAHQEIGRGATVEQASNKLAREAVSGAFDLGLNLVGGVGGTELGARLARQESIIGSLGQTTQRLILKGENETLLQLAKWKGSFKSDLGETAKPKIELFPKAEKAPASDTGAIQSVFKTSSMARRVEQYGFANGNLERSLDGSSGMQMYFGSLHGHSRYSDGMGLPKDLYAKAAAEGQHVTTITDHNHAASRGGIGPGDARAKDQTGTPINTENPIEYSQTFADAAATTVAGKHVSLVGTEMGTIGKVGSEHKHSHGMVNAESVEKGAHAGEKFDLHEARLESNEANHLGGVNHINLFEVPTFFEAVREPKTGLRSFIMRAVGKEPEVVVKPPDVIKYNDGDYRAMVDHLDKIKDTTGNTPIVQLNHPRYLADENPTTPAWKRGRDYGQKSFKNQQEWLDRFADKYVRQIELIKGGALNPSPVDKVPTGDLDPTSFAGYIDKKVHASPTFGRDFHFGEPVGNPGATGFYAKGLDKPSILEAMRERRTIATTSSKNLSGLLTANDRFLMGSIVDQSAVPSLSLKMRIDGNIDPAANYAVKLWGDTKVGDGKLAEVLQQRDISGADLLKQSQTVAFDAITGKVGQNSAYYVEVQRKDPHTANLDRMWTAPIWLEQLAGGHSLFTRWMTGSGSQLLPVPNQQR